jgi:hypothetical protein
MSAAAVLRRQRLVAALLPALLLGACSSVSLPSIEESNAVIDAAQRSVAASDSMIRRSASFVPRTRDVLLRIRRSALNAVIAPITQQRSDDLTVVFRATRPLVREQKSVLGIGYTNTLNIDTGRLVMNFKRMTFQRATGNRIDAFIELEGRGAISASGSYTGIPASASPEVELYLAGTITFDLVAEKGGLLLKPRPATLPLKAKFSVSLLQWKIPWYQEIPLQVTDLVRPLPVPMNFVTEIPFPLPANKAGEKKIEYVPHRLVMSNSACTVLNDIIEWTSQVEFRKK